MPRRTQDPARFLGTSSTGFAPSLTELSISFDCPLSCSLRSYYPGSCRFGLFPFRSPLLRESLLFSLPPGTKMFQFPGLSSDALCIPLQMTQLCCAGFLHSDTCDSLTVYVSSQRFAVFCVLLRLCMPRHPPYALAYLICLHVSMCFRENC